MFTRKRNCLLAVMVLFIKANEEILWIPGAKLQQRQPTANEEGFSVKFHGSYKVITMPAGVQQLCQLNSGGMK